MIDSIEYLDNQMSPDFIFIITFWLDYASLQDELNWLMTIWVHLDVLDVEDVHKSIMNLWRVPDHCASLYEKISHLSISVLPTSNIRALFSLPFILVLKKFTVIWEEGATMVVMLLIMLITIFLMEGLKLTYALWILWIEWPVW